MTVGSIAAALFGGVHAGLIYSQNKIAAQQAELLRAQTIGVIIKELRDQEPLNNSSSALIAAFGGVAYEIVSDMVLDRDTVDISSLDDENADLKAWINAMHVVSRYAEELSADERRTFRHKIIGQYVHLLKAANGHIERTRASRTTSIDRYIGYLRLLQAGLQDFNKRYPHTTADYRDLDSSHKRQLSLPLIEYFSDAHQFELLAGPSYSLATKQIDAELNSVCDSMGGISIDESLQWCGGKENILRANPRSAGFQPNELGKAGPQ